MNHDSPELFDRMGGAEALSAIVKDMYERIFKDPELAPFFQNVQTDRLRKMQYEFLASAFQGPVNYTGAELTAIHHNRGIHAGHFAKFCSHFADAARAHGAREADVDQALGQLATYKDKITGDSNIDG
ncbi:globin [Rhodopirellula maiorica SM1]|uniref:Globin n=1 Tax=Rhodopirellula maiorica SM1 TaxID=1265738 RepID=M5RR10_9BACT|nr:group 1 truncated hemoglobin [Rhodopirellula maiorica]EMI17807.1 globin [Rhodopirellula maiorica SM1]